MLEPLMMRSLFLWNL